MTHERDLSTSSETCEERPERTGRRALMMGAVAAGAGAAAGMLAASQPAGAANGGALLLGETNSATKITQLGSSNGGGLEGSPSQMGRTPSSARTWAIPPPALA
jgi:hypothetical protein